MRALFDRSSDAAQSLGRLAQILGPHITECATVRRSRAAIGNECGSPTGSRCASDGGFGYARRRRPRPTTPKPSWCISIRGSPSAPARTRQPLCACKCSMPCRSPAGPDRLWMRLRHPGNRGPEAGRLTRRCGRPRPASAHRDTRECHPQRRRGAARDTGRSALAPGGKLRDLEHPGRSPDRARAGPHCGMQPLAEIYSCRDS